MASCRKDHLTVKERYFQQLLEHVVRRLAPDGLAAAARGATVEGGLAVDRAGPDFRATPPPAAWGRERGGPVDSHRRDRLATGQLY